MKQIVLFALFWLGSLCCFSAAFTPGNLVVVRVGDGTAALSNSSTAVYLDEYTTTGSFVQTIAVPNTMSGSNHPLTMSGKANSEGVLTLSANRQYLTFAGYDTTVGYAGVASGITNRVVARVDAAGAINTTTGFYAGSAYVTGNIRGAVSNDGSQFWTTGSGSTTGGVWYLPFGSFTASAVQTSTTITNARVANIFGGQLYFSTSTVLPGIYTDGTGLPTTAGQVQAILPGLPTLDTTKSPYCFFLADLNTAVPGVDVLYVADDDTAVSLGGLHKYSLVGGSWVSNGFVYTSTSIRGMTGFTTCKGTSLFLTSATGVYTFRDTTGYNNTIVGTYNQIVTAATNTAIRGIAFTPGSVAPVSPTASIASVVNVACYNSNTGSINTTISGGVQPLTYTWSRGGFTTPNISSLTSGVYRLTVTDNIGCSATVTATVSQPAAALSLSDSITNLPCTGGSAGRIKVTVAGGYGRYQYTWSPSVSTGATASGLTAGTYYLSVTDSAGCLLRDSFVLSRSGNLLVSDSVKQISCYGAADGKIKLYVSSGTPTYTYLWSNTTSADSVSNLPVGNYTVTISDAASCQVVRNYSITQPDSLSLSFTKINVTSTGGSDGSIALTVSGGTPGYRYAWNNGLSTKDISNLSSRRYCVTVTDFNQCTATKCDSLSQPTSIGEIEGISSLTITNEEGAIKIDLQLTDIRMVAVEVYSISGAMVYAQKPHYTALLNTRIATQDIGVQGYYILKISTAQGALYRKVVIQ